MAPSGSFGLRGNPGGVGFKGLGYRKIYRKWPQSRLSKPNPLWPSSWRFGGGLGVWEGGPEEKGTLIRHGKVAWPRVGVPCYEGIPFCV